MYPGKSWSLGLFMPPREVPKLRVLRGWLNPRRALPLYAPEVLASYRPGKTPNTTPYVNLPH